MLTLTQTARETIARLIAEADRPLAGLKIAVESGGCAGLRYAMALVDGPAPGDQVVTCVDTTVYVAPTSRDILAGTTIDFVERPEGAGFTFDNPNAADRCACAGRFAA